MPTDIRNTDDVIDSRDVIARIEELEAICLPIVNVDTDTEELDPAYDDADRELASTELAVLKELAKQGEDYAPDWAYGETLIRDGYFREYAEQLADDIGAINAEASWPNNCIDWERAARELQVDYASIDFDGATYWIR